MKKSGIKECRMIECVHNKDGNCNHAHPGIVIDMACVVSATSFVFPVCTSFRRADIATPMNMEELEEILSRHEVVAVSTDTADS